MASERHTGPIKPSPRGRVADGTPVVTFNDTCLERIDVAALPPRLHDGAAA